MMWAAWFSLLSASQCRNSLYSQCCQHSKAWRPRVAMNKNGIRAAMRAKKPGKLRSGQLPPKGGTATSSKDGGSIPQTRHLDEGRTVTDAVSDLFISASSKGEERVRKIQAKFATSSGRRSMPVSHSTKQWAIVNHRYFRLPNNLPSCGRMFHFRTAAGTRYIIVAAPP